MNVERSASPGPRSASVDAANPWLGLASFSEETRAFFHGREDDAAELARRVQRKLLTVLFGQSGHGKTSLLRAGLVPRLRDEGYCPVYVRLDYAPESPPPSEQIKAAIFAATQTAGTWTKTGSSVAGESLWEFLHHRDDKLADAAGRPLIPLLIFDQFEEIFTLAQNDDAGRRRAQAFLGELADLVENRPPAELERRIECDEADAAKFDFARADYRVLISLREDYLAHLEGLKARMPSVTQNRVRLARFTGAQALAAVRSPAPQLVSEAVAAEIVRFVSGNADLAHAEVEPSLLSLVCRELNNARLARGQAEITADLLAGSRETILSEFYERALADQPAGVRRFIEDELLTDSGHRESVAEARVKKGFAAAGATPDALALLVGRRLLRVEERLDVRRVELTHDVLCAVVKAGRDTRHEREAKEAVERQLAATQAHELATRRALWRARLVATICGVVAIAAVGSAVFGYLSRRRAVAAERQATEAAAEAAKTRQLAEAARGEAEKLITFLVDDLWRDLAPFGRHEVAEKLARSAVEYYKQLPAELRTPATERNRGLALARLGDVLNAQNNTDEAGPTLDEAVRLLDALHTQGDRSNETTSGLALALLSQGRLMDNQGGQQAAAIARAERAVALLRPLATAPGAPRILQHDLGLALHDFGFALRGTRQRPLRREAIREMERVYAELRRTNPLDIRAAQMLGLAKTRLVGGAIQAGQPAEALTLGDEALALYDEVLKRQPANLFAVNGRGIARNVTGNAYAQLGQLTKSVEWFRLAAGDYETSALHSPTGTIFWGNLILTRVRVAAQLAAMGRLSESAEELRTALALEQKIVVSGRTASALTSTAWQLAHVEAMLGHTDATNRAMAEVSRLDGVALRDAPAESELRLEQPEREALRKRQLLRLRRGAEAEIYASARDAVARLENRGQDIVGDDPMREFLVGEGLLPTARRDLADAALRLGKFTEAETVAREAANALVLAGTNTHVQRINLAELGMIEALAIARQGRGADGLARVEPLVALARENLKTHAEHAGAIPLLAQALFIQAVAQPPEARERRRALLEEARALMAEIKGETAGLVATQELREWIAQELAK